MRLGRRLCISLILLWTFSFWTGDGRAQTLVSFQTEDGWTIRGDLLIPKALPNVRVPGVVLLSEPGWLERSAYDTYLALELQKLGIASVAIDMRGTGRSLGPKEFATFSPKEIDAFQLDITAAIRFLTSQKMVDPRRIGIVGPGIMANYTVLQASEDPAVVQAIALISGKLGQAAREYIRSRENLPIFYLVDQEDKPSFQDMANAYSKSQDEESRFMLAPGHGPNMFTLTKDSYEQLAKWLSYNLAGLGIETDVSFQSSDGWTLHGTLHMPQGVEKQSPVAGIVLTHGARHDQKTFYHLARALVKKNLAVLTFDWRGKGRSTDDERWPFPSLIDPLNIENMNKIYLDVKAGVDFLAKREGVDGNRIGLLGATWSTAHVILAAIGNARIKTIVLLTAYGASNPDIKKYLTTSDVPILAVEGLDDTEPVFHPASRDVYLLSKSKYSQLLLYTHAGHGSEMFHRQPELQPTIVRWFMEKLDHDWSKNISMAK